METKRVLIVMGSRSDLPSMEGCMKQLDDFQVGYEVREFRLLLRQLEEQHI